MSAAKIIAWVAIGIVVIVGGTFLSIETKQNQHLFDFLFNFWPWLGGALAGLLGGLYRGHGGVGTLIDTGLGAVMGFVVSWLAPYFGSFINNGPWDFSMEPALFLQWVAAPLGGLLAVWIMGKVREA